MPESIGKTLKKIRESKALSIEEVSERTRIPKKIIQDLEEDRIEKTCVPFYAKNFIRSYSKFLGAQEEKVIKAYLSGENKPKIAPSVVVKDEKGPSIEWEWVKNHKKDFLKGIVVIFCIWFLFFGLTRRKEDLTISEVGVSEAKVSETKPHLTQEHSEKKESIELEIAARSDTWLQVISDGELYFRGIFRKGEKDIWLAEREIKLELGNAGGVKMKLNGRELLSLGRRGEKKEIVITKDGVVY